MFHLWKIDYLPTIPFEQTNTFFFLSSAKWYNELQQLSPLEGLGSYNTEVHHFRRLFCDVLQFINHLAQIIRHVWCNDRLMLPQTSIKLMVRSCTDGVNKGLIQPHLMAH